VSRLNRIHPLKTNTFVLDFRNEAEDIADAFEPDDPLPGNVTFVSAVSAPRS
jgi:hypothetical protein